MGSAYTIVQAACGSGATIGTNPTGVETGGARVLRGGAWNNKRIQIRVANRSWQHPKPNPPNSGFQ